jgi:TetR/AcrR family transcriptional regulator, transcriptional repressor for nem operon
MPVVKTSKEEILRKSTLLIWDQGYKQTSFSDLSKACGIRNAHFFYYFKDKEDLMTQILEGASSYFKEKIFAIAYRDELSPDERLKLMVKKLNVLYMKNYGGCLFGNTVLEAAHNESPFLEIVKDVFREFVAALQHLFSATMSEEDSLKLANEKLEQLQGAAMMMRLFKDRSHLDNFWQKVVV